MNDLMTNEKSLASNINNNAQVLAFSFGLVSLGGAGGVILF